MTRPLLLDLFCCAGGAARGYHNAGFDVIGVDIENQPRYPYTFIQYDAIELLDLLMSYTAVAVGSASEGWHFSLEDVAAVHASPPCQGYSVTKSINPNAGDYPKLIQPVRERLRATGLPYVIENVEGARADMLEPLTLCGSQFRRRALFNGHPVYLRRHRLFESNFLIPDAGSHRHHGRAFPVFGHGPGGKKYPEWMHGKGTAAMCRQLMDIDWMTREELDESIPPAYTEYIGEYLMDAVRHDQALEVA